MNKEPVKTEVKKEVVKEQVRREGRADTGGPPLEGGGGGQVQEFYPLGAGSEVIPPTPEEVADAVNNEAGK